MIEKLTAEQEEKIDQYKKTWIDIGLSQGASDKKNAEKYIKEAYKVAGLEAPDTMIWADSPVHALSIACEKTGDTNPKNHINNFCFGCHESSWLGFYNYCGEVLELDCCNALIPHMEIAKSCGWWLPYDELVIISEKPLEVNMKDGVIHKDGGPAIIYKDGLSVWALNGVRVGKEIAETPWNELDPNLVITEKNAEIRKEIVRKIGVERISQKLGAEVIDKEGDYELLNLLIGDETKRPYLKMKNPSLGGVWHLEGIHPDIKTVKEALKWRNGTEEIPEVLT